MGQGYFARIGANKREKKNQTQGRYSDCCAPNRHEAIQEKDKN
jgi:hypothetical protein